MAPYYGADYYNSESGKFTSLIEKVFRFNHISTVKRLLRDFPANVILEVGCGRGYFMKQLKAMGCQVTCLESGDAADWILQNQEIEVVIDKTEEYWPFDSAVFDLVLFWHVLEHLPDPVRGIQQARRCLRAGGVICISVPNIASRQASIHKPAWFHLDVPRHLHHFSTLGLTKLLEDHGFQVERVQSGDRLQNLYGWLQTMGNLLTPWAANSFYRLLQGGTPLKNANPLAVTIQLITLPIWMILGLLGYLAEELWRDHGTITVYARKRG